MPPKKKNTPCSSDPSAETSFVSDENDKMASSTTRALEEFIDRRLRQQSEQLNDLFIKHSRMTKSDLDDIKKSQDFLGSKFDGLAASVNELRAENKELRQGNQILQERVAELEKQSVTAELDVEQIKQYLRRDLLEIHGVPVTPDENTNNIVQKVVQLIYPDFNLDESEISTSHRLPASEGYIQPIIAKFTRRSTRDMIYHKKRQLRSKSSLGLGFQQENSLYINESLTFLQSQIPSFV